MGYRRCDLCGSDNQNGEISVFTAGTKMKECVGDRSLKYICEQHFNNDDIVKYKDGRKR